jgi:hypothetical protein
MAYALFDVAIDDNTFIPSVTTSGLIRPSSVGPQLLKLAIDTSEG